MFESITEQVFGPKRESIPETDRKYTDVEVVNRHSRAPKLLLRDHPAMDLPIPTTETPTVYITPMLSQKTEGGVNITNAIFGRTENGRKAKDFRLVVPGGGGELFDSSGKASFVLIGQLREDKSTGWYVVSTIDWNSRGCDVQIKYTADIRSWNDSNAQDERGYLLNQDGEVRNGYTREKGKVYDYRNHSECEVRLREDPVHRIPVLPSDEIAIRISPRQDVQNPRQARIFFG